MKVMVAEDDQALSLFLQKGLELEGHAVECIADGATAVEKIRDDAPDLLVLDLGLPQLDGVDVLRALVNQVPGMSILVLSGRAQLPQKIECLNLGADDYAEAQGQLVLGGYSVSANGSSKQVNHPTTGRIPIGGSVERGVALDLAGCTSFSILLQDADFSSARMMADAINKELGRSAAHATNSRSVELQVQHDEDVPELLSRVEGIEVALSPRAKVVVNERTSTVVIGGNVVLQPASILHGGLAVNIVSEFQVSQPNAFSKGGTTQVVQQTQIDVKDKPVSRIDLKSGSTVEDLVRYGGSSTAQPFTQQSDGSVTYNGNAQTTSVALAGGGALQSSLPGSSVFTATSASVFGALNDLITGLNGTGTLDSATLVGNLTDALNNVSSQRAVLNTAQNRLSSESDYVTTQKTNLSAQQSTLLTADPAALATELSAVTTQQNALMSTIGIVQKGSLFDYL